jgi:hypothetical protein
MCVLDLMPSHSLIVPASISSRPRLACPKISRSYLSYLAYRASTCSLDPMPSHSLIVPAETSSRPRLACPRIYRGCLNYRP